MCVCSDSADQTVSSKGDGTVASGGMDGRSVQGGVKGRWEGKGGVEEESVSTCSPSG